jgi:two-component system, chemotaxis family, protein-glutamate methylesterase/glutaminase
VTRFEIVALAASAGGLKALSLVLAALPAGFPAPLVVVQHLDRRRPSLLTEILLRRTALRVEQARTGRRLMPGTVYIAPSDHHLLVNRGGFLSLTQTELVHFVRPSADRMFESTAAVYRDHAIAVVLSGSGVDGATGVRAIKKMGGTVIVQDRKTSEFFGMPDAAERTGVADFVLPLSEIAPMLEKLVHQSAVA